MLERKEELYSSVTGKKLTLFDRQVKENRSV
jgi:hypothetical protein